MKKKVKPASSRTLESASPTLEFERGAGFPRSRVIGVDEVGRGCLAGPVVAAAVLLPPEWDLPLKKLVELYPEIAHITDSKAMTAKKRSELAPWIQARASAFGIAHATVEEIDQVNIYHASHLAMKRAADALGAFDHVLVDGNVVPIQFRKDESVKSTAIIKGDLRSLSIACASVIAKVFRDDWMKEFAVTYPGYGLEVHKGYATAKHRSALTALGATVIHRRTFGPVREALGLAPLAEERKLEQHLNSPFLGESF
jgi:ribonuclease HII